MKGKEEQHCQLSPILGYYIRHRSRRAIVCLDHHKRSDRCVERPARYGYLTGKFAKTN